MELCDNDLNTYIHNNDLSENIIKNIMKQLIEVLKYIMDNNINNNDDNCIKYLRSGDIAKVRFAFLFRPEYIENNSMFIFRENTSKGIGKIIRVI